MPDFIDAFLEWTEDMPSPYIFRLWSAIAGVGASLERRVWATAQGDRATFANLYVLLVAAPGIGKGVIEDITDIWRGCKRLKLAPDSVTAASLLDSFLESKRTIVRNGALQYEYHSLIVSSEEFGVLVSEHDREFLSRLNKIFTNPELLRVRRKYLKEEISIHHPQLNILAGTQPGYLASLLPEEAWTMGFTQRLLMIYAGSVARSKLFTGANGREAGRKKLVALMEHLVSIHGEFQWEPDAMDALSSWHNAGGAPAPRHARLAHYLNRRTQFMIKLMLISAASRGEDPVISHFDYERAMTWLMAAEAAMPEIFREMVQKSDSHLLKELIYFMWENAKGGEPKPMHRARLMAFFSERAPSEKVHRLIDLAEQSGMIRSDGRGHYLPVSRG